MAHRSMIKVDRVAIKTPSTFEWELNDVSASDAGRTSDALMHKNRVARKRKIKLSWSMPTPEEAKEILTAFAPEYFEVTYHDPLIGEVVTKTFYCGDQAAPVKRWAVGNKRYENITFNIIER